jgi:hypothetical protein
VLATSLEGLRPVSIQSSTSTTSARQRLEIDCCHSAVEPPRALRQFLVLIQWLHGSAPYQKAKLKSTDLS